MKRKIIKNKMSSFDKISLICLSIIALYLIFPLFTYNFCNTFSALYIYIVMLLLIILMFSHSLILKKNISKSIIISKQIIYGTLWCMIYIIIHEFVQNNYFISSILGFNFNSSTVYTLLFWPTILICNYYLNYGNTKIYKMVTILSLVCLAISAIISISVLQTDPSAARSLFAETDLASFYRGIGVAGYSIAYSIPILFPMLIGGAFELKGIKRVLMIVFCILLTYYVYLTALTTALVGILFGIIILFVLKLPTILKFFLLPVIFILSIIFTTTNTLYYIFLNLSKLINVNIISIKMYDIANSLLIGKATGEVYARTYRYNLSLVGFYKSPLVGIYFLDPNYSIGNHATFLDILASTGLIGFILFALWLFYAYKDCIKKWKNTKYLSMFQSSFIVFLMLGFTKSIFGTTAIFFTLMFLNPGIAYLIEDMECVNMGRTLK